MTYTFDDLSIGTTLTNKRVDTKLIDRPKGLTTQDWYDLASKVCQLLNTDRCRECGEDGTPFQISSHPFLCLNCYKAQHAS